jgi:hypothetical protein
LILIAGYGSSGQIHSRLFVLLNELVDEEEGGGRSEKFRLGRVRGDGALKLVEISN